MGIREFFDKPFFDPRHKFKVHIAQLVLMLVAVILTIARMSMPVMTTRANMMALTMVSLLQTQTGCRKLLGGALSGVEIHDKLTDELSIRRASSRSSSSATSS